MKKIHFALFAIVAILSACSKEQYAGKYQEINPSELSSTIVNYVDENFPDAIIVSALQSSNAAEASYVIGLNTAEEIVFDASGLYLGDAEDYNASCDQRKEEMGKGGPRHGGGGHGGGPGGHNGGGMVIPGGIPIDSLPTNIPTYINSTFANARIMGARFDSTCQFGKVINVMVRQLRTAPNRLTFDLSGNYLFSSERTLSRALPQVVKDSIAAHYTINNNVKNSAEKITLANSNVEYNIYLRNNGIRTIVTVLDNGIIVCTK